MSSKNGFVGERIVAFEYVLRNGNEWRLVRRTTDPEVERKVGKIRFPAVIKLPSTPQSFFQALHNTLAKHRLDGGRFQEDHTLIDEKTGLGEYRYVQTCTVKRRIMKTDGGAPAKEKESG
jgi:hypothetical protein